MASPVICLLMLLPQVSTAEVQDLVRQLDADRFAQRSAATQRLAEMGSAVFDELAQAAMESGSREVEDRALKILQDHFKNGEASIREAAEKSLNQIAGQDSQAGRQAQQILKPEVQQIAEAQAVQRLQMQQMQIAQIQARIAANRAQIQIQGRIQNIAPGNVNRRIQVSTNGRKIKIEVNNGKIKMEIEETNKDGKKETKKYEADSEAELKKKHPEAYREYERYAGQRRAVIVPQALPQRRIQPKIAPPPKLDLPPLPDATRQRILDTLKRSEEKIDKDVEELRKSLKGAELDRALESLERRRLFLKKNRERYDPKEAAAKAT